MKTPDRRDADAPRPRPLSSSSSWSPAPCGACPRRPTTSAARSPRRRIPCSTRSTSVPPNSCNTWRMPRGTTTPPPPATPSPPRNGGSASAAPSAGCGASATRRGTGIPRVPRHGVACCRRRGDRALPPASPVLLRLPPCASPSTRGGAPTLSTSTSGRPASASPSYSTRGRTSHLSRARGSVAVTPAENTRTLTSIRSGARQDGR
mmetsp:Transcript_40995/g.80227  ORF Transcript_40995/g.80227 Transcript_40995/m.80227 type:complete len:206 (-) Transcript_40995:1107-1724(-)